MILTIKKFFIVLILFSNISFAQKTYNVYLDTDNSTTTGCSVIQSAFATQFDGVDGYIAITTGSSPVTITSALYHECQGAIFDAGSAIVTAALGLNASSNGDDVFEMQMSTFDLGIRSSSTAKLYYTSESPTSSDIVIVNNTGGGILFGVAFPIPVTSFLTLVLLILIVLIVAQKFHKNKIVIVATVMLFSTVVWGMITFVIDGNTGDWSSFTAINDPLGDNSAPGNFSDIRQVYGNLEQDLFTARIDVLDVENQAPSANPVTTSVFEEATVTITLSGADLDGDPLTFSIASVPTNGTLSAITAINATSASVDYTSIVDFVGTDAFTYVANDGQDNSIPATVDVTVNPVNDAPSFTSGGDVTVLEDSAAYSSAWASAISQGPSDESTQTTSFNISNVTNPTFFSSAPVVDIAGNLTFTAAADAAGTSTVTINIMDNGGTANGGIDTSTNITFDIIITDVNDVPSFTKGADQTVLEDAGIQTVAAWATGLSAGPPSESGQVLSFNVSNNNNALFSVQPSVNASGDLSYTTNVDANGTAIVTLSISDDGGTLNSGVDTSADQTFNITITAVNDAPSFTKGVDQSILEDLGAQTVTNWATAILEGPADESTQITSFNVSNDNNGLFSVQPSVGVTGDLTYTANADVSGVANVTISISDDGGVANGGIDTSANQMFTITVVDINDVPSFTAGANQTSLEDSGIQTIAGWATGLSPGPASESGQVLSFNVSNNNNLLFSSQPSVNSAGTLTFTSAPNVNGVATVVLSVSDDGGTANGGINISATQTFTITITAVNDAPSFTSGGNIAVLEDSGAYSQPWASSLSAGPTDESSQTLSFNITANSAANLFSSVPLINNSGQLSFTPAVDAVGVATVTVNIMDNGGVANGGSNTSAAQMFTITLNQVNDAPSFVKGADQTFNQDSGSHTIVGWATSLSAGPANESVQLLSFNPSNDNNALFSVQPSVNAMGDLNFTSAAGINGSAVVTINIMDNGGTANFGVNISANQTFNITILNPPPAKADPSFNVTTNIQLNNPAATGLLNGATGSGTLAVGNVMNPAPTTTTGGGNLSITTATGAFTYNPPAGLDTGTDSFVYKICNATQCSADIAATLNLSGNTTWFVDISAAAGDGRLTTPFNSIAAFMAQQGGATQADPASGDCIFLAAGNYTGPLNLLNSQKIIGTGTTIAVAAECGLTPATNSASLPATNGARPVISSSLNGINLGSGNSIRGLNLGNALIQLNGSGFGTLTVNNVALTGTGKAVDLTNGTTVVSLDSINSSGSASEGIDLLNVAGNFTVTGAATIDSSTTQGISIINSAANVNITSGSIATAGSNSFTASGNSGSVSFGGTISQNIPVAAVRIVSNPLATTTLSGMISASTSTATAIDLDNHGIVNLTGGMSLITTSGSAFTAVNAGTINVTGTNTATSTTGTAVTISGSTIGASDVIFQSVNSNGGANAGIVLSNTGSIGGLVVTGTTVANSGGVIQNKSDAGIILTNTNSTSLSYMRISATGSDGIRGTNVTDLSIDNSTIINVGNAVNENGIDIAGLFGISSITNSSVTRSAEFNVKIENNTATNAIPGTPDSLTITNSSFGDNTFSAIGADGVFYGALATANMSLVVNGMNCTNCRTDGVQTDAGNSSKIQFSITNSVFLTNNVGLNISSSGSATSKYNIFSNISFNTHTSNIVNIAHGTGNGTVDGEIRNNPVLNGSSMGNGVRVVMEGSGSSGPSARTLIGNNVITDFNNPFGIQAVARAGTASHHVTIEGNTVTQSNGASFADDAVRVSSGNGTAGETNVVCLDIESIAADGNGGLNTASSPFGDGYEVQQRAGTTFMLEGLANSDCSGSACLGTVAAQVIEHITDNNTGTANVRTATRIVNYTNAVGCLLPVL